MKNKLALALALIASLQAAIVNALSLGDLVVESKVNEPLNAVIELRGTQHLSPSQILVQIAGPEEFRRASVDRPFFLTGIEFKVEQRGAAGSVLRLTTKNKITEPYLNFILDTRWPEGRLLREYLALLDLPIQSDALASEINSAEKSLADTNRGSILRSGQTLPSAETQPTATNTVVEASTGLSTQSQQYRVKRNDTASKIAKAFAPSDSQVAQTLLSIYENNPSAFANGDVNRLKNGAVLRIPSEGEISQISARDAQLWRAQQHAKWKEANQQGVEKTRQAVDGSLNRTEELAKGPTGEGILTLTSKLESEQHASEGSKSLQQASSAEGSTATAGGDANLVTALEQLDRSRIEKASLDQRYTTLQGQFEQLEKLVELKNAQLAELTASVEKSDQILTSLEEKGLAATEAEFGVIETNVSGIENGGSEQESELIAAVTQELAEQSGLDSEAPGASSANIDSANVADDPVDTTVVLDQNAPATTVAPADLVEATSASESEPATWLEQARATVTDLLQPVILFSKENVVASAGGLVALLGGILGLILLRKRSSNNEFDALDSESSEFEAADFDIEEDPSIVADDDDIRAATNQDEHELSSSSPATMDLVEEEVDNDGGPLAEADIYLSYGRHDQAIDCLHRAIEASPTDSALHLKLVEVYHSKGDMTLAQQSAEGLLAFNPAARADIDALLGTTSIGSDEAAMHAPDDAPAAFDDLASADSLAAENDDLSADIESLDSSVAEIEETFDALDLDGEEFGGLDLNDTSTEDSSIDLMADADSLAEDDFSSAFDTSDTNDATDSGIGLESDLDLAAADDFSGEFDLSETEGLELDLDISSIAEPDSESIASADLPEAVVEQHSTTDVNAGMQSLDDLNDDGSLDLAPLDDVTLDDTALDQVASDISASVEENSTPQNADSLDSEFEQAYADLEIDLNANLSDDLETPVVEETEVAPTTFGNPSVEEAIATNDIPTLDIDDSPQLGLSTDDTVSTAEEALTDADLESEYQSVASLNEAVSIAEADVDDSIEQSPAAVEDQQQDTGGSGFGDLGDAVSTKLDLARAYLEMGDMDGAKDVLDEVISEGDDRQQQEANALLQKIA